MELSEVLISTLSPPHRVLRPALPPDPGSSNEARAPPVPPAFLEIRMLWDSDAP